MPRRTPTITITTVPRTGHVSVLLDNVTIEEARKALRLSLVHLARLDKFDGEDTEEGEMFKTKATPKTKVLLR
jgi:hypothetical protein